MLTPHDVAYFVLPGGAIDSAHIWYGRDHPHTISSMFSGLNPNWRILLISPILCADSTGRSGAAGRFPGLKTAASPDSEVGSALPNGQFLIRVGFADGHRR